MFWQYIGRTREMFLSYHLFMAIRKSLSKDTNQGEVIKPLMVQSYNMNMGGVDRFDQRLSYYSLSRKSKKWWKKVFFRLSEMALINSMILFHIKYPDLKKKKSSHHKFREMLIHKLVQHYLDNKADSLVEPGVRPMQNSGKQRKVEVLDSTRLTGKHFPTKR